MIARGKLYPLNDAKNGSTDWIRPSGGAGP